MDPASFPKSPSQIDRFIQAGKSAPSAPMRGQHAVNHAGRELPAYLLFLQRQATNSVDAETDSRPNPTRPENLPLLTPTANIPPIVFSYNEFLAFIWPR